MVSTTDNLGILLHDATRLVRKRLDRRIAHLGLSTSQWRLLVGTLRSGSATQARLAEKLEIEPISVSRLIDRMEQAGWVTREADPADRRAKIIVPTEKAQASYETIRNEARGVISEALTGISNEHQVILMECLQQLVTNLSTDEALCSAPLAASGTRQ